MFGFPSHLADNYPGKLALLLGLKSSEKEGCGCTGDGGTSRGDFHEAMNFAAARESPIGFICNNNQYAYSTPLQLQMNIKILGTCPGLRYAKQDC